MTPEHIVQWAIAIIYKIADKEPLFLIVENRQTGNISFVSGAEDSDDEGSLETTAQREIQEELGLDPDSYTLIPTNLFHEFTFDEKKIDRSGLTAKYQIFLVNASEIADDIDHSSELTRVKRMTENEVLKHIIFPELKDLFTEAIKNI